MMCGVDKFGHSKLNLLALKPCGTKTISALSVAASKVCFRQSGYEI
jgi:hypothetical protein